VAPAKIGTPDTDFEVRMQDSESINSAQKERSINSAQKERGRKPFFRYALLGIFFGIILTKAEIISWYRIQEMFRLQSFHMYGVIGSAVVVGIVSVWPIKRFKIKTIQGEDVALYPKKFSVGQVYGGLLFGLGWGMTGACPGPIFAQIGTGTLAVIAVLLSAIAGTWVYGYLRERLPH
jgi:uncharacterized membrane protein YedE/YeeE